VCIPRRWRRRAHVAAGRSADPSGAGVPAGETGSPTDAVQGEEGVLHQ